MCKKKCINAKKWKAEHSRKIVVAGAERVSCGHVRGVLLGVPRNNREVLSAG